MMWIEVFPSRRWLYQSLEMLHLYIEKHPEANFYIGRIDQGDYESSKKVCSSLEEAQAWCEEQARALLLADLKTLGGA